MYETKTGQTVMDVLLQNKGALRGLVEVKDNITSITQVFEQGVTMDIEKELTQVVKNYDRTDICVASEEI